MTSENKEKKSVGLKILEAYTRDVGRGVARIDYDSMDELGASTGDVLEIKGKRTSYVKCLPLYPSDEGKEIIRTDGLVRNNVGGDIGTLLSVKKTKAFEGEKIVVIALEAIPPLDERYLADALESVPVVKGDNIMIPYFGGRLNFQIMETTPVGPVLITTRTVFQIIDDQERFEKYSKFKDLFKNKESDLLKELESLLQLEYTDEIGDKVISTQEQIDKIRRVRKIAIELFKNAHKHESKSDSSNTSANISGNEEKKE